jgi:hypothetical protein
MCAEHGLGQRPGFQQRKAQQHRTADGRPDGFKDVRAAGCGDALDQHRVDGKAYDDKQPLKADCQQGTEIVVPHVPEVSVYHRGKGQRGKARQHVNLDHPAVHDHEDKDVQGRHGVMDHKGLQPQAQQRAQLHLLYRRLHIRHQVRGDVGGALYQPCGLCHHTLGHVEHRHDDIEGVGEDRHGDKGFNDPLEKQPGVDVMEIVPVYEHLDQLIAHDKGEDDPGYWQYNRFGKLSYQGEHPGVPCRRGCPHLYRDLSDPIVQVGKKALQVAHDPVNEQAPQPFRNPVGENPHRRLP